MGRSLYNISGSDDVRCEPTVPSYAISRALFKMTEADDKTLRKLAWFAQEKLQEEKVPKPDRKFEFEPGFGLADCVRDYETLVSFKADDKAFEWYEHLYGPWYAGNQAYSGPGRDTVEQLINERGQLELDPNLERKDTAEARAFIDKMLSVDSEENPAWFDAILDNQDYLTARNQLQDLKVLAERRRQNDAMAMSNPIGFSPVSQVPLPKTEYYCGHCKKKLFLTTDDPLRCDDCGCKVVFKPDTK